MTNVAIIGNAGGGKSTLSRRLSQAIGLPLHTIDLIQWKPGWVATPAEELQQKHEAILAQDRWIIDGWGGWDNIAARFDAADTIILIDFPLYIHYWWAMKRQFQCIFRPRPDLPEGCPMLPMTGRLIKLMWTIHHQMRPRLLNMVKDLHSEKQVFHIRSPRELRRFIREHCEHSDSTA